MVFQVDKLDDHDYSHSVSSLFRQIDMLSMRRKKEPSHQSY